MGSRTFQDKLIQNIQEIYLNNSGHLSSEKIVNFLLTQRDFHRHKKAPLKKAVEDVLKKMQEQDLSDLEDEEGLPEQVELMEVKDTNSLNATLLNNYKKRATEASPSVPAAEEEKKMKKRKKSKIIQAERPTLRYSDLGGIDNVLEDVKELIEYPLKHPELYVHLGVEPPKGILLHGPPGCGKTSLAHAIAGVCISDSFLSQELNIPFMKISAPEVVSGMSGESEARLREIFTEAKSIAPCLIFIDEIDAITPKRENAQREMERRIVAQLLTCLDDISNDPVMIIGATNRPDSLDPALRRAGRFDREIRLDEFARQKILKVFTEKMKLFGDFDFLSIAKRTPGYVGADLKSLTREAAMNAVKRAIQSLDKQTELEEEDFDKLFVENIDFEVALKKVQPSAKREGFAVVPEVTWDDIGALESVREELRMSIVEPIKHPERFRAVGISAPTGVLLYGPPGCGKTLLAKAIANESHSNFISVKGPELLNKYVGESERGVRQVFERARCSAPCVIFFDEIDALCPRRSDDANSYSSRLVNQLLTEMDGMEDRQSVFMIAATNRPDMIDPAVTRPGRLDKLLYVQLPCATERFEILKTVSKKTPLASDVSLLEIANDQRLEGFSGADLSALVREASVLALKESFQYEMNLNIKVGKCHFELALNRTSPSVSASDRESYDLLSRTMRRN